MRSDKDQMTAGKEKSIVEIQLKDAPREQENVSASAKPREEKKEVFTKVRSRAVVYDERKADMETRRGRKGCFSTKDSNRMGSAGLSHFLEAAGRTTNSFHLWFSLLNCSHSITFGYVSPTRLT